MTQHRTSNVVDLIARSDEESQATPGRLLDVIPLPETDRVVVIVAHVLAASGAPSGPPEPEPEQPEQPEQPDTGPRISGVPGISGVSGVSGISDAAGAGGLLVDRAARRVWTDGREVTLTYQEYELLDYLTARPARVFSRVQLMNAIWAGATEATTRTVDVHIHRLRRKLGRHGEHLVTVRRVGYGYRPPPTAPVAGR